MISVLDTIRHDYQPLSTLERIHVKRRTCKFCLTMYKETMRPMIGFRVEEELKGLFEKVAEKENRSLSNFIINAILVYLKEHHKIDWHKLKNKSK